MLEGDDGLMMLRGQWIEVDRDKLQQAPDHWQAIESEGGVSFVEGMRLLAGASTDLRLFIAHRSETDDSKSSASPNAPWPAPIW